MLTVSFWIVLTNYYFCTHQICTIWNIYGTAKPFFLFFFSIFSVSKIKFLYVYKMVSEWKTFLSLNTLHDHFLCLYGMLFQWEMWTRGKKVLNQESENKWHCCLLYEMAWFQCNLLWVSFIEFDKCSAILCFYVVYRGFINLFYRNISNRKNIY